jgi:hypothetical protein
LADPFASWAASPPTCYHSSENSAHAEKIDSTPTVIVADKSRHLAAAPILVKLAELHEL